MEFEEKHNNYLFDRLTVIPYTDRVYNFHLLSLCVTADPDTNRIYVLEEFKESIHLVIFSESGNIVNQFTQEGLCYPKGIAVHKDNLYITFSAKPFLVHFKVADDLHLIRSREDIGSGLGNKFNKYKQFRKLAVSIDGDVFVTEFSRHRIQILDGNLHYKQQISHDSMVNPCDVKLTADEVFVFSLKPRHSRYCILVFDLMGYKLRSIIPRGLSERGLDFLSWKKPFPYPGFCLDSIGNFIINDVKKDEVRFFTKEGTLFQKLGMSGADPGMFSSITGLTLTTTNKLVVVSMFSNFKLQIFSWV